MIGVIAKPCEHQVISEFFELFKTPWEYYRPGQSYEVLLCTDNVDIDDAAARLIIVYSDQPAAGDTDKEIRVRSSENGRILLYKGLRLPIYGRILTFRHAADCGLLDEKTGETAIDIRRVNGAEVARVGFNLFDEIRTLLTLGQPSANANSPTLDLHIRLLRDLIIENGRPLIEIPPVPDQYPFIVCLTHDVDHPSVRRHKWDHTTFGFLYRAVWGSVAKVLSGRASIRDLLRNWIAVLKLPLVHLGLAKDFWEELGRYPELEKGLASTFFVIPFKDDAGWIGRCPAPKARASRYRASDIAIALQELRSEGCEIGLHGIDAWHDSVKGREELNEIRAITGQSNLGVRMHWLYLDEESPVTLENAGATYDSSFGYNETVGFRAGTTQAFKPLNASKLLELPLHVMDTALFYPSHMNLPPSLARKCVLPIVDHAFQSGGTLTVNWHDRSIAPERLWDDFYVELVQELRARQPWFSTASDAVSWFQKRRSATFDSVRWERGAVRVTASVPVVDDLPSLRLRIYPGHERNSGALGSQHVDSFIDVALNGTTDTRITFDPTLPLVESKATFLPVYQ